MNQMLLTLAELSAARLVNKWTQLRTHVIMPGNEGSKSLLGPLLLREHPRELGLRVAIRGLVCGRTASARQLTLSPTFSLVSSGFGTGVDSHLSRARPRGRGDGGLQGGTRQERRSQSGVGPATPGNLLQLFLKGCRRCVVGKTQFARRSDGQAH